MIEFTKMHGLGNDYVYIDCTKKEEPKNISELAKRVSNRHFGIGSDGLILIENSKNCDFKMKMFNYDGSEAQMCGNGIRCVGKYVYDNGLTNKKNLTIETLAGTKTLKLNVVDEKVETVEVDMGEPILDPMLIPVISDEMPVKNLKLKASDKEFVFTCVSMGNPHAVTVVEDLENFDVEKYGKILEVDKHFPQRANIEFIEIEDRKNIKMRVWERGTGETFACGTGSCAVCVASNLNNYTDKNVNIKLLGGTLKIDWRDNNHVHMTGSATKVFEGKFDE